MSYNRGKNRLFYQSKLDNEQVVEAEILNPKLELSNKISMVFLGSGLYYLDIWFRCRGSYFIRVYENTIVKHKDILKVGSEGMVIYPDTDRVI